MELFGLEEWCRGDLERLPNIGPTLGRELRAAGIDSRGAAPPRGLRRRAPAPVSAHVLGDNVLLAVADLEAALAFYGDRMGLM